MIRQFVAVFITLLLASCTPGDHKSVPRVIISKKFPSMTQNYKTVKNLPEYYWWKQFQDPELNRLVDCGLKHNPDIHIAFANLEKARGELKQVKLSWIPILKLYAGYSTNPALGIPGGFYGAWPYYVLNLMQLYTQQKQAQYNVTYHQAAIQGVRLLLIGQIASAYFTLTAQREQLRLLKELEKDVSSLLALNQRDIAIGLNNELKLADLKVAKQLVRARIKPVENNIVVSQNALRFLVNQNPGEIKTSKSFVNLNFSRFKPGALPATVLCQRPDIKMAEFAVKRAHAGISVAYSDFFPNIQLDEFFGEVNLPTSRFAEASDAYLNPNLSLSTFGRVDKKKGAYQASVAEYIKTVRRILRDVDNDFSANRRAREAFEANDKAKNDYRYKFQLQEGLLKTGLISYRELLDSKLQLDDLALLQNQAKLELAMSLVLLYQDLAGGYVADKVNG